MPCHAAGPVPGGCSAHPPCVTRVAVPALGAWEVCDVPKSGRQDKRKALAVPGLTPFVSDFMQNVISISPGFFQPPFLALGG